MPVNELQTAVWVGWIVLLLLPTFYVEFALVSFTFSVCVCVCVNSLLFVSQCSQDTSKPC